MHRPTTVIMARPIAWPMIRPMESSVLATALAEVCMVPKGAIIPTTTTRPSWNRQFSRAEGTPMPKIRLSISGCSRATYCGIRQTSCFGLEASPIMIPAATPICKPYTHSALPPTLIPFITRLACMETLLFPVLRKMAAPALYSARKGKDRAVMRK